MNRGDRDRAEATNAEKWDTVFSELEQHQQEHGDCNVPQREGKLGYWVNSQRTSQKERKVRLDSTGINDIANKEANKKAADDKKWNTMFSELKQCQQEHGYCNVPQRKGKLGKWVSSQRTLQKNNRLPE